MASLSQSPFNTNAYGVQVQPLDYSVADAPTIQTYHGASIVANGNIIGRISSFQAENPYNRGGTHIYEVSNKTWGLPVDYVPGKSEGFTMAIARAEVWQQEMEIALGFGAVFENLTDQTRPFTITEYLFRGQTVYRIWQYSGCWFNDKNIDAYDASGDGIIKVTAKISYVSRHRIQG